jgi:glyoxylate reductase
MKSSAVFMNTTRGPVVDEGALVGALQSGAIFSAGLDVFSEDPKIHPGLLACENVVLLPHIGSGTEGTRLAMAEMAVTNLLDYFAGDRPKYCVNPEVL